MLKKAKLWDKLSTHNFSHILNSQYFRYNAIIRPLKPRMGRPMTILVAVTIWLVAMAIAVPQLLYFTIEYQPQEDRVVCYAIWPDGPTNESKTEFG